MAAIEEDSSPTLAEVRGGRGRIRVGLGVGVRVGLDTSPSTLSPSPHPSPSPDQDDRLLHDAGVTACTVRDRALLHEACVCVSTRAARLSATATAALIEHAQLDQVRARLRARVRVSPYPNPTLTLSP